MHPARHVLLPGRQRSHTECSISNVVGSPIATPPRSSCRQSCAATSDTKDGRPANVCGEPRMFTNAIKDGADPKNIDLVTINTKGKKFPMCDNCKTWVPGFGGEVLTG
ncbi:hypothetical protein GCM10010211_10350 [Streptomyces albospinus]|uniref:Uncharacterized protein n=1 Tax=Streptomyces albospinus TaxID=285515 RepID=A0ABQ2URS6_9ACTN|nr:hypothetical protein GCM10010211_10350 [Streptomyces albospinus]